MGVFEGEHVQKQPTHIRRIERKYWAVHFKCHCRNSSLGCIRHEEKSECSGYFQHLILRFLFSDFCVIYFLAKRTRVRNGLHDIWSPSIT
jgi:hypothetical protein